MIGDQIHAALAASMPDWLTATQGDEIADALIQAARLLIANQLLAAADEQDAEAARVKVGKGTHAGGHQCAADHLRIQASEVLRPLALRPLAKTRR